MHQTAPTPLPRSGDAPRSVIPSLYALLVSPLPSQLWANMPIAHGVIYKTESTCNTLQRRPRRTKPWATTSVENLAKFRRAVSEICLQRNKHDHQFHHNTPLMAGGGAIINFCGAKKLYSDQWGSKRCHRFTNEYVPTIFWGLFYPVTATTDCC